MFEKLIHYNFEKQIKVHMLKSGLLKYECAWIQI